MDIKDSVSEGSEGSEDVIQNYKQTVGKIIDVKGAICESSEVSEVIYVI